MADDHVRLIAAMAKLEASMHTMTTELRLWRLELAAQRTTPRRPPDPLRSPQRR